MYFPVKRLQKGCNILKFHFNHHVFVQKLLRRQTAEVQVRQVIPVVIVPGTEADLCLHRLTVVEQDSPLRCDGKGLQNKAPAATGSRKMEVDRISPNSVIKISGVEITGAKDTLTDPLIPAAGGGEYPLFP